MSEEKFTVTALGLLKASDIGGEACEDCPHNIPRRSCVLLTRDGDAPRLLFKYCELVQVGTKARLEELEAENRRLRKTLEEIAEFANENYEKRFPSPSCATFETIKFRVEKALKGVNHGQQKI